jgi:amidase
MARELALNWAEYAALDATAMAGLIRSGEVSATQLAAQAAAACEALNPQLNAVIEVFDDAVAEPLADGLNPAGPLAGVPMLLKDLGSRMRGRAQENGYAWNVGYIAEADDPFTENLRRAGCNLIGRTTTPEDGMTLVTETIKFGITRNPWNLQRSSGGSSGGSAAAVAAGIVPLASASDGGGSIRIPAAWNALVGLKTTRGRQPLPAGCHEGLMPSAVEGVVTRSVRDTALIYDALVQCRPLGSGFMPYPACDSLQSATAGPGRPLRVAVSTGQWGRKSTVHPSSVAAVQAAAAWLEAQGHSVEEVEDGAICDFELLFEAYRVANWVGPLGNSVPATAAACGVELSPDNTSNQALQLIAEAREISLADFQQAVAVNAEVMRQWGGFWERGYDILLTPTTGDQCPVVRSEQYAMSSSLPFAEHFDHVMDAARYTMPGNETGLPAISVPAGVDDNGCPVGVQFYAPWTCESRLIAIAAQWEQGHPQFFSARPAVHVTQL